MFTIQQQQQNTQKAEVFNAQAYFKLNRKE